MKLEDIFDEIFTGFNINNSNNKNDVKDLFFIQKDSIEYTNIISNKLVKKRLSSSIKNKYYMQDRDIIISVKRPYKVGTYRFNNSKPIVIPNNFIILRGINRDLYSFIFIANYLEKIGIEKYIKENNLDKKENKDLTISDVKNIVLPSITKAEQMKITNLINSINDRSAIYSNILKNDDEIIKYALNTVIGDEYAWCIKKWNFKNR